MPRQTREQASQGRKDQTIEPVTRPVQAPCACFDPAGRDHGLFGPTVASVWWNRCVSTARPIEPQVRCILNRVEGHAAESLFARLLDEASLVLDYVKSRRVAYLCLSRLHFCCRK